jgi:type I restriction enzyme S subunit
VETWRTVGERVVSGQTPTLPRELRRFKRYPEYKDSGVEWLGEIPAHWLPKKVKRLCIVRRGASPRPIDDPIYFDGEGEYAWVRIADVTASDRYLAQTTQRLSSLGRSKSVSLAPGELFVSIAATVGKPIITRIKCCIHDGFVYFVGLRENREFLYYLFSCGEPYKGLGKLGTQLNLNTDTIGDIYLPIPDCQEQAEIVRFLDRETARIDALIVKKWLLIELLQEKRTALITRAVTKGLNFNAPMKPSGFSWFGDIPAHWAVRRWRYCCRITEGQVPPEDERYADRIMIAPNHVESGTGRIMFTETAREQAAISGKYLVRPGDVIYSKIRPALNKVCLATGDWLCSADMYPVSAREDTLAPEYLLYFMLSEPFVRFMVDESMRVAMPKVNREKLAGCPILLPPREEQSAIVASLKQSTGGVDFVIAKIRHAIQALEELRSALVSAAVTGKIDVREKLV